jgi:hypothetical protein
MIRSDRLRHGRLRVTIRWLAALVIVCGVIVGGIAAVVISSSPERQSAARGSVPPEVTFRGVVYVDLDMSVAEVQRKWGRGISVAPQRSGRDANVFALICIGPLRGYGRFQGRNDETLLEDGARLVELTFVRGARTLRGVGIGSTRAAVTRAYGDLLIRPKRSSDLTRLSGPDFEHRGQPYRKTISFRFHAGRVSAIHYGWRGTRSNGEKNGPKLRHDRRGDKLVFSTPSGLDVLRC